MRFLPAYIDDFVGVLPTASIRDLAWSPASILPLCRRVMSPGRVCSSLVSTGLMRSRAAAAESFLIMIARPPTERAGPLSTSGRAAAHEAVELRRAGMIFRDAMLPRQAFCHVDARYRRRSTRRHGSFYGAMALFARPSLTPRRRGRHRALLFHCAGAPGWRGCRRGLLEAVLPT